ncbi:MAG: PDZ domain-containing protein [Planctomycetes bacterium]|nr:PDZ domain-containing protein [Planctomycetota bacterium]
MHRALAFLLLSSLLWAAPDLTPFVGEWKHEKIEVSLVAAAEGGLSGTLRMGERSFRLTAASDGAAGIAGRFTTDDGNSFAFTATLSGGTLTLQTGKNSFELTQPRNPLEDLPEPAPAPPPPASEFQHPTGLWRLTPPRGWERGPGADEKTVRWTHGSGALVYVTLVPEVPFADGEQFFRNAIEPGLKQAGATKLEGEAIRAEGGPPLFRARFERSRENVQETGEMVVAVLGGTGVIFQITIPMASAEALAGDRAAFLSTFRLVPPKGVKPAAKPGREDNAAIDRAGELIDQRRYDDAHGVLAPLAQRGEPRALFLLAYLVREGLGVPKNPQKACELYRASAEAGFPPGMNLLAICYREGLGVKQDFKAAMEWFQKAALRGNGDAALSVGALYVNGQGVQRDFVEGFAWYMVSGTEQADMNMEQLYEHMSEEQLARAEQRAQEISSKIEFPAEEESEEGGPGTLPVQIMRTEEGRYVIRSVQAGSNAAQAGLQPGDILVAVDGTNLAGVEPARLGALLEGPAGSMIQLQLLRGEENVQLAFPRDPAR